MADIAGDSLIRPGGERPLFSDALLRPNSRPASESAGQARLATSITPAKILIVDDQPPNLDALEAVLAGPDCQLVRAQSAHECLLALLKDEFAAIVLDIKMPGISGLELAHLIKQRKRTEHIPILFLTAHLLEEQDVLRGYGAGAVDYLSKPVNPAILRSKVAVFVDLFRKTRALADANSALQAEIAERHRAQEELRVMNSELEWRVRDRTAELTAANHAMRESEQRYRQLVQALPAAVYTCDPEGYVVLYNQAAVALWGREPQIGKDQWCGSHRMLRADFAPMHPEDCPMAQAIREGRPVRGEEVIVERPDGSRRHVLPCPEPIFDSAGQVIGAVNMLVDITEHKRIEEEKTRLLDSERLARSEAERANRLKDEFLATVSHELRNPLHAVMGWAGLLRKSSGADSKLAEGLEIIERNARIQAQLISDLLDVSRITSGKMRLNFETVELGKVIHEAVETVRHAADAKHIRIDCRLPDSGPRVAGDPRRIQQIVWNLLSNAVKFTPSEGHILVSAESEARCVEGDGLLARPPFGQVARITVADSGQGISHEFLPHIFDRFRQADSSASRKHGGLGIGLAIARHLVELHGGRIEAQSPGPDQGSTFRVELPTEESATTAKRRRSRRPKPKLAGQPVAKRRLDGLRVLVVDDEADGREFIKRVLEESGASVLTAGSAAEGLQTLLQSNPDILLSDIGMPGEDGYQFIARVRAAGSSIPAVAVTAFARSSDRERAQASGYHAHLSKPLDAAELLANVCGLIASTSHNGRSGDKSVGGVFPARTRD